MTANRIVSLLLQITRAAALAAATALPTAAQNNYCMSVHAGPATGVNSGNAPAKLGSKIGSGPTILTPTAPGQTAAQASAAHEAAYRAAGYATSRSGPNEFCVTAGPGGAPLSGGLCYGTDDTNLDIDGKVRKPPAVPGVPVPPGDKGNGVPVPVPPDTQPPLPFPGLITILVEIRTAAGTTVVIAIHIQLPAGLNGAQLRQLIEQVLRSYGLLPNRVQYPSVLQHGQWVDGLLLERTIAGDQVVGIEYAYDSLARHIVHQNGGAGFLPYRGAGEYGPATRGMAPFEPWVRVQGTPSVGSSFDVYHELGLPFAPGGTVVGLVPAGQPFGNGWLLIEPGASVFEFAMTDAFGVIQKRHTVPNHPGLIGLPLCEQAGVTGPNGIPSLTPAVRCILF